MKQFIVLANALLLVFLAAFLSRADAQLFYSETGVQTKPDGKTWRISVKEIERLPRASVIEITTVGRPQSVGGSIAIACMMAALAREREWRFVAQTSDTSVKKIGGLEKIDDDPVNILGDSFAGIDAKKNMDVEKFAWLCDSISRKDAPLVN